MSSTQVSFFDLEHDRRNTNSMKWHNVPSTKLAMWVADMDFMCPTPILEKLKDRINEGFLGYPYIEDAYYKSLLTWFQNRHSYSIENINIIAINGIIPAITAIINKFTSINDAIIIQTPVYYRLNDIIEGSGRKCIPHVISVDDNGNYNANLENLYPPNNINVKIFILCSPHNPLGKLWTLEELLIIGEFCIKNNVLLVADEIHCDLTMPGHEFISVASLPRKYLQNTVILNSSTKTFNIAGLRGGNVFSYNDAIHKALLSAFNLYGIDKVNIPYLTATTAGYINCGNWLNQLNKYISLNSEYVRQFLADNIPHIKSFNHEATYLMWIDYRELDISEDTFCNLIEDELLLSRGSVFGLGGQGFMRVNIACPIATVEKAMNILKKSINSYLNS